MGEYRIPSDHDGRRADRLIRTLWKDIPLGGIMKALRTGGVRLDGKKTEGSERVKQGQLLQTPWPLPEKKQNTAVSRVTTLPRERLDTLYKDERIWCVNKPAGLLSQPDRADGDSLITRALQELKWERSDFRPSCAHRLDRNTSGLLLIALDGATQRLLAALFKERLLQKTYWAVVAGATPSFGRIQLALKKDAESNRVHPAADGESALTLYKTLAHTSACSLVELDLVTGRSHQARAHMAAIGHPIWGDIKYGGRKAEAARPLLHARAILFPQQEQLGRLSDKQLRAPLPRDLSQLFSLNGWDERGFDR